MHLIFRMETAAGDMSGRYNVGIDEFYTPLNVVNPRPNDFLFNVRMLVFWAYAVMVCDQPEVNVSSYRTFFDDPEASVEFFSLGTKLKKSTDIKTTRQLDKYEAKDVPLNGFIRRLPEGQKASEHARQMAIALGFDLADNETYVQPFIRRSWVLKQTTE